MKQGVSGQGGAAVPSSASDGGPLVVIVGASGFTNLGDDAILAAMLAELRDALPGARFRVASGDPAGLTVGDDVETLPFQDRAIDRALSGADLLLVGGGGFIYDYDTRVSVYDFLHGIEELFYPYYRAVVGARARGIPVHCYGIGVGPLLTRPGRALTREILSLASAITVRDPFSLWELHAAGLRAPAPELTADPAVRLPAVAGKREGLPEGKLVGFVARAWLQFGEGRTPSGTPFFDRYVDWLAAAADHAVARWGGTPLFLPLQRRYDDDRATEAAVIARMRHGARARLLDGVVDYREAQMVLGGLDALVSTRLHPLILAASAAVPTIGIDLAPKVRAFLGDLGLASLALSPWVARTADLTGALDRALADPGPLRARLHAGMARQAALAARNPAVAARLVGRPMAAR